MTIAQTVDIPENRWLNIKVPQEVPTGRINVVIQFPVCEDAQPGTANSGSPPATPISLDENGKIRLTQSMKEELLADETLRSLTGILHTDMTIDEIRNERLAKQS